MHFELMNFLKVCKWWKRFVFTSEVNVGNSIFIPSALILPQYIRFRIMVIGSFKSTFNVILIIVLGKTFLYRWRAKYSNIPRGLLPIKYVSNYVEYGFIAHLIEGQVKKNTSSRASFLIRPKFKIFRGNFW